MLAKKLRKIKVKLTNKLLSERGHFLEGNIPVSTLFVE